MKLFPLIWENNFWTSEINILGKNLKMMVSTQAADTFVILCGSTAAEKSASCLEISGGVCEEKKKCFKNSRDFACEKTVEFSKNRIQTISETFSNLKGVEMRQGGIPLVGILDMEISSFNFTGILGIAGLLHSCRTDVFFPNNSLAENFIFLKYPTQEFPGSLQLVETLPKNSEIIWAQRQSKNVSSWSFPIFQLNICGIDLLGETSSFWIGEIYSSAECLFLPAFIFDRISNWAGAEKFPGLNFSFSNSGDFLKINFENVCVVRKPENEFFSIAEDPIIFGTAALAAFSSAAVSEISNGILGRVGILPISRSVEGICKKPVVCRGQEEFFEPGNFCRPPKCGNFFFYSWDPEKAECRFPDILPIFSALILGLLVFAEIFGARLSRLAASRALQLSS